VFGPVGTYLGRGIVGGHLFSWEHAGVRTAELALRVLHGANPRDVPPSGENLCSWIFDARQLKRWGIRESALPPGSAVRFREPSLWRQHPWGVLGVILFILAETALIVGLVLESRRHRRAQEQRRLLSAIVESSNDAIIGIDTETRIVSWNTGAQNVFGYTAEEAIGHGADLLVPPDRLNEARSAFEATMAGRTVAPFETVRLRKDGSPVEVSITDSPIRDPWGKIVGTSPAGHHRAQAHGGGTAEERRAPDIGFLCDDRGRRALRG
jgi:PAS domain S-box-containing protein